MKTTTIPAQITTVEDKIAGSLSLTQLMLLCAPIFLSAAVYILFPPLLRFTYLKLALFILVTIGFCGLSIRLRGKIVVQWLVVIGRYNLRPRYYVFDKNDMHLRKLNAKLIPATKKSVNIRPRSNSPKLPAMPLRQLVRLQTVVNDPRARLSLSVGRKGGMDVRITQIK